MIYCRWKWSSQDEGFIEARRYESLNDALSFYALHPDEPMKLTYEDSLGRVFRTYYRKDIKQMLIQFQQSGAQGTNQLRLF